MHKNSVRIAFYGKGGIGKSTISSNISAALAASGKRVLHIGCDPKSDSTRCLTKTRIPTVLHQINRLGEELTREDIVFPGVFGVQCIEAGGPQAGSGCAGMGITAMEQELNRLHILDENWDVVIYDVLGDVVCGGFAVPMRKHFVEKVFVVTSADFMSIYAANNILKGIRSCAADGEKMFGGLILNHCTGELDFQIAKAFAERTDSAVLSRVAESREIKQADYGKSTVCEAFPGSTVAQDFRHLAELVSQKGGCMDAKPLDESELDAFCEAIFD